jgi:predicted TIM-barrel fold metal-dependent hydrolase
MDSRKIDKAVVSSASAITYRNAQSGNEELYSEIEGHRDRFIPFGVINPSYAGWADDLKACHEGFGIRGIRLYPWWHNYSLSDPSCLKLVHEATQRGLIIAIPMRVEDPRERSWLVNIPDVQLADVARLVKPFPESRFMLLNGLGYPKSILGQAASGLPANYVIEISRLSAMLENEIGSLVVELGADRLVFGSGMPFNYPDPALLKLEVMNATREQREAISWKNAAHLLGIE